jgi:DNA modification methylase
MESYLSFMEERIRQLHRVLKPTGSFYLHCDYHANAHLRIMCDEIFGENNFQNEIVWCYSKMNATTKNWIQNHDTILFYTKSNSWNFNILYLDEESALKTRLKKIIDEDNKIRWLKAKTLKQQLLDSYIKTAIKRIGRELQDDDIIIDFAEKGKKKIDNVWYIPFLKGNSKERLGYPTQKPEALLERIIEASSNPTDIVLDAFCGCGTTLAVAQRLGRRFVGIDFSHTACTVMAERIDYPISDIIGMPMTVAETKKMKPFEFQNWACRRFGGMSNPKKTGDDGIDGWKSGIPIEVKQHSVGSPAVKKFITAIQKDSDNNKGYMIAYDFTKGAKEDKAWAMEKLGIEIEFIEVKTLLRG